MTAWRRRLHGLSAASVGTGGARFAFYALAIASGLLTAWSAWRSPGFSAASDSVLATVVVILAGWALVVRGIAFERRGRRRAFGVLLAIAGLAWFAADWANPAIAGAIPFTIGLAAGSVYVPVVFHAVILVGRPLVSRIEMAIVAVGYAIFGGLLGILPALTFDASAIHCSFCPADLIAIAPSTEWLGRVVAVGTVAATVWAVVAAVAIGSRLARQSPASRRVQLPVTSAGLVFVVLVGIEFGRVAGRVVVPVVDPIGHLLRLGQGSALIAIGLGVVGEWLEARRARLGVARVVADLVNSAPLGGLRDTLASTLGDPALSIAYKLPGERLVDAAGQPIRQAEVPGRRITPIVREGTVVALLDHRADVLDAPAKLDDVVAAARLGLEHERLQAEGRAQLIDLTAARKRIVATGADARRRLERDLHDGAQQHLIAISIKLRLIAADDDLVEKALGELLSALDELRDLAHGLYPSVLAEEGLAAAIEGLAERSRVPVAVGTLPEERVDPTAEVVAYEVLAEVVASAAGPVRVSVSQSRNELRLDVSAPDVDASFLEELRDRVGAIEGSLGAIADGPGRVRFVVELPCAS